MSDQISFSAQCPNCKNEISQGPRDPDEMRRLLREDSLSFYCELCDLEWEPSHQELTNVESLLSLTCEGVDPRAERLKLHSRFANTYLGSTPMAACTYCQSKTELYESDVPICAKCAETSLENRKIRTILFRDLAEATARVETAREAFTVITDNIPSGLPHPDGTQSIHHASRALSVARAEMLKTHTRLNDFLNRGIVPDDLKQNV